jgi:sterol desaturase/sphingolipid hydroxylase (fatty acid hydroxylase superfamily)
VIFLYFLDVRHELNENNVFEMKKQKFYDTQKLRTRKNVWIVNEQKTSFIYFVSSIIIITLYMHQIQFIFNLINVCFCFLGSRKWNYSIFLAQNKSKK